MVTRKRQEDQYNTRGIGRARKLKGLLQTLPSIGRFTTGKPVMIFTDASTYATSTIVIQLDEQTDCDESLKVAIDRIKNQEGQVKGNPWVF